MSSTSNPTAQPQSQSQNLDLDAIFAPSTRKLDFDLDEEILVVRDESGGQHHRRGALSHVIAHADVAAQRAGEAAGAACGGVAARAGQFGSLHDARDAPSASEWRSIGDASPAPLAAAGDAMEAFKRTRLQCEARLRQIHAALGTPASAAEALVCKEVAAGDTDTDFARAEKALHRAVALWDDVATSILVREEALLGAASRCIMQASTSR